MTDDSHAIAAWHLVLLRRERAPDCRPGPEDVEDVCCDATTVSHFMDFWCCLSGF